MEQLKAAFLDPPNSFRPQPFWFLNYHLDHDLLRVQIAEMAAKGVGGAVIHPRHGLKVPFMSKAWLDAVEVCLEEMAAHGMEAWLYDEDNWPSGFFGGRLTRPYPENRMRYLRIQRLFVTGGATFRAQIEAAENTLIAAVASHYQQDERGQVLPTEPFRDISAKMGPDGALKWAAPPGRWLVTLFFECPVAERVTWFRGYYIDTMNPAAMRKFLEACYEPNLRFERFFGDTIKGVFTDEPGLMIHDAYFSDEAVRGTVENPARRLPGITLPWTRDFFTRFERLKGYDLRPRLLELVYEMGDDWRKVRLDFFDAVSSWYVEAYHQQLSAWCSQHGLEYIGHTLEDPLFAQVRTQGNQTRVLEQMHRPGADYLGHGVGTKDNPFRVLGIKCASSVAHVMGRPRVMVEAFGASGHGHTLADRRLDLNFMAALGVNMIIPHAFYYSFVGLRKTDWPPCEFYHAPFWPWYRKWADYIGRVCLVQTQGHHVSGVAILSPVKTVALNMVRSGQMNHDLLQDRLYAQLSDRLLRLHYDFDYLDESQLERARTGDGVLGFDGSSETYRVVILPALEVISRFAAEKLLQFFRSGGHVLALGCLPLEADRRGDDERVREIMAEIFSDGDDQRREGRSDAGGQAVFAAQVNDVQAWLAETLGAMLEPDIIVESSDAQAAEDVICCHRTDGRAHLFFTMNRREHEPVEVTWHGPKEVIGRIEEWDLETGQTRELAPRIEDGRHVVNLTLEGGEARVLVIDEQAEPSGKALPVEGRVVNVIELGELWDFESLSPNVLVLDDFQFTPRDVQLGEKLGTNLPGQANSYTTHFVVQGRLEGLRLVLDDMVPELPSHVGFLSGRRNIEVLLNGELLPAPILSSWVDPYFLEIPLDEHLRVGENTLQIALISLLEEIPRFFGPAYIIGRFEVDGRVLKPARPSMTGLWNENGYPYYSGIAAYSQRVEIAAKYASGARLTLELDRVYDSCRVVVNGQEAGVRLWRPWAVDITGLAKAGANEIRVEVANTATNLFDKNPRAAGLAGPARIVVRER
ncbi:MAG: glycosyl hydrolase [Armatimonadetes bacterium]|nr:glycosyl hydrolase [Armatimonadota bacterium]